MVQASEAKEFEIVHATETQSVKGQAEAASVAKTMSRRHRGRVTVEREDGRVQMQYRDGELITYLYETRDRRRKK